MLFSQEAKIVRKRNYGDFQEKENWCKYRTEAKKVLETV